MVGPFSIFKQRLRRSIIDSLYTEVVTKTSRYYHWLGKENMWSDFLSPYIPSSNSDVPGPPQNNFRYDLHVRRDMLTLKYIETSDVSYVAKRINWVSGQTFDMYDDAYTTPIESAKIWTPNTEVFQQEEIIDANKFYVNDLIKHNGIYYEAVSDGTLGNLPPTHVADTATNGTVELKYYSRDVFAASGATSLEESHFYVLSSGFNVYKCIWNNNDRPSTVEPSGTSTDIITTADGYKWKYMYSIPVTSRSKFLTATYMPVVNAVKSQFYTNGEITEVIISNPGSGYTDPTITVDGDGTGAELSAIVEDGQITSIVIDDAGEGYTYADITITDDDGEGAVLIADFSVGNIDSLQANVELTAVPKTIEAIKIVDGGSGYSVIPQVIIEGDGTGATAVATIGGGAVVSVDVTNVGSGYTWTNIKLIGETGTGATARAIMSPPYGHGYNAIDELNANSLMFFSTFSKDKNLGMTITNDYRKVGLVRNITEFGSKIRFKEKIGSGCVKIKVKDALGNDLNPMTLASQDKIAQDWLVCNKVDTYKKYRIIDFDDTHILLSVFNNFDINIGDTLAIDSPPEDDVYAFEFVVSDFTQRTVDQFSGDLLFLRVSEPFKPDDEQRVTVRTVLTI